MKREDESSLELLLDTMCNTFGGVMFIAITLAVVLFSKSAVENAVTPEEHLAERREELLAQIAEMRARMDDQNARRREMSEAYLLLEQDPRLKALKQLAALEELVKSEAARKTLLAKELAFMDTEIIRRDSELQQMTEQQHQQDAALLALASKIEQDTKAIETLTVKLQKMIPLSMAFTTLESHDNRPSYFILLKGGKLWRVGPGAELDEDGIPEPLDDVEYTVKGNAVCCTPDPDEGVPALDGDALSPECLKILADIPASRGARFCFAKEDAAVFYKMRELMKAHKIFHGFNMEQQSDSFTYYMTDKAHYEY